MNDQTADLLSAGTSMGAVTLRVGDLDALTTYYTEAVTLTVQSHTGSRTVLGRGGVPLLILEHAPELRRAGPLQAGLFHTAIVFETEADLAAAVYSVATRHPNSFTGSADHLVSKAFYFDDPEGNGLELYWDRDPFSWNWVHGRVEMATLRLDPNRYLAQHLDDDGVQHIRERPARIGHVHLCVGDSDRARHFYVDRLGFETTNEISDQALFVSAGGYHHHMAMNTWTSAGAGRRRRALGLGLVQIEVPSADDLGSLKERLGHFGMSTADDGRLVTFDDPWLNRVQVSVRA